MKNVANWFFEKHTFVYLYSPQYILIYKEVIVPIYFLLDNITFILAMTIMYGVFFSAKKMSPSYKVH